MKKKKRKIALGVGFVLAALGAYVWFSYVEPKLSLFDEDKVAYNFRHMDKVFPSVRIGASPRSYSLAESPASMAKTYMFNGATKDTMDFFERSKTTSLLVIHDDKIAFENYWKGYTSDSRITSYSVAKSFVSTLVGIAIDDGLIASVQDPISDYVPGLKDSGFHGVPIADVLQMSSGIDFSESYGDKSSDVITIFDEMFIWMHSIDEVTADYKSKSPSGEKFQYASINTHALTMLIRAVSGKSLVAYLEEALWDPLGMQSAFWSTDHYDNEIGFMGLNARTRDFAKLGLLFLHKGFLNGEQLVSESWVYQATHPDKDYLQPGRIDGDWGYQYQWWIPKGSTGDFAAIGIWGQFIYVDPTTSTVIVKTSADDIFKSHEYEAIQVFRAIAAELSR